MRVLIHWIQYDAGGVDTQIAEMIRCWPDNQDQFTILSNTKNKGVPRLQNLISGQNVVYEQTSWNESRGAISSIIQFVFHPIHFVILILKSYFHLKRFSKNHDAIMVHAGTYPGSLLSLAAIVASSFLDIPKRMLVVHHGAVHGNMLKKPLSGLVDRLMHKHCTDIVAVSLATRESLILHRGFDPSVNPIRLVYNGLNINSGSDLDQKVDLRQKFNIATDKILIGLVGRIERYKGHEDLLRAVSLLDKNVQSKFKIMIIGGGSEYETNRLTSIIKKLDLTSLVTFSGYIEGSSIDIIRQLDLLLMLTKDFEGFGLTVAEAMIAKTPLVATKVGAIEEFVTPELGTLVSPESPYEIACVLTSYSESKELFQQKADAAHLAVSQFSGDRMSRDYKYLLSL